MRGQVRRMRQGANERHLRAEFIVPNTNTAPQAMKVTIAIARIKHTVLRGRGSRSSNNTGIKG